MMGTFLSFYFYFFLKAKIQTSAFAEFTESFLQYPLIIVVYHNLLALWYVGRYLSVISITSELLRIVLYVFKTSLTICTF